MIAGDEDYDEWQRFIPRKVLALVPFTQNGDYGQTMITPLNTDTVKDTAASLIRCFSIGDIFSILSSSHCYHFRESNEEYIIITFWYISTCNI